MKAPNPKHLVFWLLVIVIVFAAILIATELFLKISSNALSPHHFNYAFSRYDTGPGGIYYIEPITGMKFMRPSTLSRIGYNGYLWTHNTDSNGFRNISADTSKKTLLLGDSLIYGHGVDPEETVVSHLNRDYNQETYNMARQGDTIFQQYVLLRLFNDDFQPDEAIIFFFINDFYDVEIHRTQQEIKEMPEIDIYDYARIKGNIMNGERGVFFKTLQWVDGLPSIRFLNGLSKEVLRKLFKVPTASADNLPPYLYVYKDDARFRKIGNYYAKLLADIARRCREKKIKLSVVNLELAAVLPKEAEPFLIKIDSFLQRVSSKNGIKYLNARDIFRSCSECFLKNDGHFTATGHKNLAEYIQMNILTE